MKITQEYMEQNPDAYLVLQRYDLDKEEHSPLHYIWNDGIEYCLGMEVPDWMVWPNREVAEFAAKQFTRLYQNGLYNRHGEFCAIINNGSLRDCSYSSSHDTESNWFGAFLSILAGYPFRNEKIREIRYWSNRIMWGTNGKQF